MLAGGARSYTALDRFCADYSSPQAKQWYSAFEGRLRTFFPHIRWPEWLSADGFPEAYTDREATRTSLDDADIRRQFDIVFSHPVSEHSTDVNRFASLPRACLLLTEHLSAVRTVGPHDCWTQYDDSHTNSHLRPGCGRQWVVNELPRTVCNTMNLGGHSTWLA